MKTIILFVLLIFLGEIAIAQDIQLTETGAYEKKEVVVVDSAKAIVLFERAMIALSDWTGPDGKAKVGIDYQEKETGTVIYKGTYSLGFKSGFLGQGWDRWADFILKVRCKDGKAQITMSVPTITGVFSGNGFKRLFSLSELLEAINKSGKNKKERGRLLFQDITNTADSIVQAMANRLKGNTGNSNDDDF